MASALLFDLDGTLVDSDAGHLAAFQRVFAPHGISIGKAEYVAKIMGASNEMIGREFLPHLTPAAREETLAAKEAAYRDGVVALEAIAGVGALLDFADANGLSRAVVTNAPRANAELVLRAIGLDDRLPIRVIGAELPQSKPDPLPYLTGLQRTSAQAEYSIAFEDSLSGVRAAVAAGLAVVGLTTSLEAVRLISVGAVLAVADFTDPRIYQLIENRIERI
jgi:HAD superfamily hydrolase (TIGR01509 family)